LTIHFIVRNGNANQYKATQKFDPNHVSKNFLINKNIFSVILFIDENCSGSVRKLLDLNFKSLNNKNFFCCEKM
jgi:hypothetical protein